jgi:hypothetical protein
MSFPVYFPKPWRPPWFGGYEGCGLQGCFTHRPRKFFESKKRLVDYSAAFANPQFVITPVCGQKTLIFGSFLPVNRGYAILKAISARKPVP